MRSPECRRRKDGNGMLLVVGNGKKNDFVEVDRDKIRLLINT